MLISILGKCLPKEEVFLQIKKYYSQNEFELLWNQCRQNFNCLETSSAGRVLDAVSILLGFVGNKRGYKHEAIDLLEKNSTKPYAGLKPKIEISESIILNTTYLFEYLIKNINKDKKRLAATAQLYIAEGLCEIIQNLEPKTQNLKPTYFAGGVANNGIVSSHLESRGVYISKKIPRGDAGISVGQLFYHLLANPRD